MYAVAYVGLLLGILISELCCCDSVRFPGDVLLITALIVLQFGIGQDLEAFSFLHLVGNLVDTVRKIVSFVTAMAFRVILE